MSIESARAFFKRFNEDEAFRASLESSNCKEGRAGIIKQAGYDFTEDEINEVMSEPQELDLDDLEAVAGGVGGDSSDTDSNSDDDDDGGSSSSAAAAAV